MPDLENHSSDESLSGGKNAISKGLNAAHKASKSPVAKKAASSLISMLGPQFIMLAGIVAVIMIVIVLLVSIFPLGNMFMSQEDINNSEEELLKILEEKYDEARIRAKSDIIDFVNTKYNANATNSNVNYKGDGVFSVNTDTANITVSLSPSFSEIEVNIPAYINSVNGVIASFGSKASEEAENYLSGKGETEKIERYTGSIFKVDKNGNTVITDSAKDYLKRNSNQDTYTANDQYIETIFNESDTFFTHDTDTSRWNLDIKKETKTYYKEKTVKGKDGTERKEKVPVTKTVYKGQIAITMFYDLSKYRNDELNGVLKRMAESNTAEGTATAADLNALLTNYYENYRTIYKSMISSDAAEALPEYIKDDALKELTTVDTPITGITAGYMTIISSGNGSQGGINKVPTGKGKLMWPTNSTTITSEFTNARTHPIYGDVRAHDGVDIGAPAGDPVYAAADGKVILAEWYGGYGNAVMIDHGNGMTTLYGHNSSLNVSSGQTVKKGQVIARVGSTGWSTGPHVHFEVKVNGTPVNPMNYF